MLKIVTTEQMRIIEAAADAAGHSYAAMMENAGRATAHRIMAILAAYPQARVTILVGKGNNGGDGLVAARILAQESALTVRCYLLTSRDDDPLLLAARDAGAAIANAEDDQGQRVLRQMVESAHLLVDALFGIGIRLPLRGEASKILQTARQIIQQARANPYIEDDHIIHPALPDENKHLTVPYVLAVDCPSGLDCNTGEIDDHAIPANETITFIAAKPGLLTFPGAAAVGHLTAATIGVPADLEELQSEKAVLVDAEFVRARLPARPVNSHKGTYGKTLIIGGSANYRGAVGLSASAAYRVGAGLVTVGTSSAVIQTLAGHLLEATWLPLDESPPTLEGYDSLLVGPGWGQSAAARDLLQHVLNHDPDTLPPLVIDADGLNILAKYENWWQMLPPNTIITPHPGEMARLVNASTVDVQANRWTLAAETAAQWNLTVMLKGAHTLIATPNGQLAALPFKTDALAKAGTGDVLAGVLAGLLAQGLAPYDAAVVGGYIHGLAGVLAAQKIGTTRSVLASDVVDSLSAVFNRIDKLLLIEA